SHQRQELHLYGASELRDGGRLRLDAGATLSNSRARAKRSMGMRHLKTFISITALFAGLNISAAKPAADHGDAARCSALAGRAIAPNTKVQSAEYLPEGGTVGTTKIGIPFCRVIGVATPTRDSHIGF